MKASILLTGILFIGQLINAKTINDMSGRVIHVPDNITRIIPYDAKTSILLFPLASHEMVAKGILPGKKTYNFISDKYEKIPGIDMNNIEEVLTAKPQIIIAGYHGKPIQTEKLHKLERRLNIPIVTIDLSINRLDQTYLFIGKLLNKTPKSISYSHFLHQLYQDVDSLKRNSPKPNAKVYYTIGASGLLTDPSGSKHTEVLSYLGIPNVAQIDLPSGGHAKVNMEQVILWNPDYIFCAGFRGEQNAYTTISKSKKWAHIKAVKEKQLYKIPGQPLGWFDHPPSINRIPGVIWMCQLFYGQSAAITRAKIIEFYELFYQYKLNKTEYELIFRPENTLEASNTN
ncbi:ABC transporter substrate-binding protein [Saccharicrinis fermentans]|uniref:Vitamin B12-transporter protein BtuF n=1 Tax=Saccharicrinis fermentans DSM 9555 = JCM 21142 TaxID=869213 RepID=W7Y6Y3_9BACT|nr:ABC transporter substrate-binding protein [Saccharicrinis fermentans]GAF04017.1 vitamin B12-transporter protein BtuF [Saccharicrinis fermentans DSM 9555 = JCM 21142]